jgi:D-arginine dehydrogenase
VIEGEEAIGFHSSGRSATMLHFALGNPLVRVLTLASRGFFDSPPEGFSEVALGRRMPVLVHARQDELAALDSLDCDIAPFATLERVGEAAMSALCPVLRVGEGGAVAGLVDRDGIRLDPNALLQGFAGAVRRAGGAIVLGARAERIERSGERWIVHCERGQSFTAAVLVNAAGAWADRIAAMAGVEPLGLMPLRRTIITFDAPPGMDSSGWPFAKTVGDELYFAPESGRLFASPMDEVPSDPCDAQPDELEVALAAQRIEERTVIKVERVAHKWAGLRTFARDRQPVACFAADAPGFFWLAGQGGFGLQTAPVMARIAESLVAGPPWPLPDVDPARFGPIRK